MKKGDVVFNEYHGIRRYGIIERKEMQEDGWAYCEVDWINDEQYTRAMSARKSLTGGKDWTLKKYRIDQIQRIDMQKEMETFNTIKYILQTRGKE